jgi:uncharacterized membrane protein YfcA
MVELWIALALFAGIFLQGVVGFGMALIAIPLLTSVADINTIAPVIALSGNLAKILMLLIYRKEVQFKPVLGLSISSLVLIPVGVVSLDYLNKELALTILGLVVVVYALYSWLKFRLPDFDKPFWMVLFGAIGGFLGGAFNTAGPPIIMYANAKDWTPKEFKSNLQGYALITGMVILISHWLKGNITPFVWRSFFYSIPVVLLAVAAAVSLDRFINKALFRGAVLAVLLGLGVKLIF